MKILVLTSLPAELEELPESALSDIVEAVAQVPLAVFYRLGADVIEVICRKACSW